MESSRHRRLRLLARGDAGAEKLRLHGVDLRLELGFLAFLLEELPRSVLELGDGAELVRLRLASLLVELQQRALVHQIFRALVELLAKALELALVLAQQGLLVEVLVDAGAVFDVFGAVGELEGAERLGERLERGEIIAIIVVLQFPPRESSRMRVSFESRYGMCGRPLGSVSALMTLPSAESDWLIFLDSSRRTPVAPVSRTRSEPARSTGSACQP